MSQRKTRWGVYKHITAELRDRLTDGTYPVGSRLPSEHALCEEFGVTRNTVRRSLAALESEGLITTLNGLGRIVIDSAHSKADANRPAYARIAADLRKLIENGEYAEGDALPSGARISKHYRVSRHTAQRALTQLEDAGLVERRSGRGRFVKRRRP